MFDSIRGTVTPASKALAGCVLGVAGMCVGLFYFIPRSEHLGTLWTMFCAVLTGIYSTRWRRLKKTSVRSPFEHHE